MFTTGTFFNEPTAHRRSALHTCTPLPDHRLSIASPLNTHMRASVTAINNQAGAVLSVRASVQALVVSMSGSRALMLFFGFASTRVLSALRLIARE